MGMGRGGESEGGNQGGRGNSRRLSWGDWPRRRRGLRGRKGLRNNAGCSCAEWRRAALVAPSILESNICKILNSVSLLMITGGGGVSVQFGSSLGAEGSNMEMWKTGWILHMVLGRWRVKEMELTWARISKWPRNFSASFFDSWVVQILSDLMKTLSPILKSSGRVQHLSVEVEYHFCALEMWERSC